MFKSVVLLALLAQAMGENCTTFTTEYVSTYTTEYYVVNSIPASQADQAHEYPVVSCKPFFLSPYNAWSCHNKTAIPAEDQCCFEDYGVLMQTQFWDYDPALLNVAKSNDSAKIAQAEWQYSRLTNLTDVAHSFTIHGLWNDLCDGSYRQYCDYTQEISDAKDNITHVIVDTFGEKHLYDYMIKYWVNNAKSNVPNGGSISLWEHEFNKHATCMNTLIPKCFTGPYKTFENTVAFYKKVVELFKNLPTYDFLAAAGIYPTLRHQYKLTDVQRALAAAHADKQVYVGCLDGAIDEIWYYHNLHGGVLTGDYKPIDTLTNSSCPANVWYIPKTEP